MDDKQRDDLKAWLEFYRDMGIEEFYRREPGAVQLPQAASAELAKKSATRPRPVASAPPKGEPASVSPPGPVQQAPKPVAAPGPVLQSMGLFDVPAVAQHQDETLEEIRADLGECTRCRLSKGRKTIVFGQGNPQAELFFVGEGPGADEDEQSLPFVGRAGQLLNKMIQLAGMKREEVYISNIVKCRPPGNRVPEKDEIETCVPFLYRQIQTVKPRLVCCLGAPAVRTLLGIKEGITKIRGTFYDFGGTKALATVHPAYVLRNPREEKILREDFEKIIEFLRRK
jgi:uracil-DNA glycosylase